MEMMSQPLIPLTMLTNGLSAPANHEGADDDEICRLRGTIGSHTGYFMSGLRPVVQTILVVQKHTKLARCYPQDLGAQALAWPNPLTELLASATKLSIIIIVS